MPSFCKIPDPPIWLCPSSEADLHCSIFNRMIGTGIFSTPSSIMALSGSVGLALFIWVAGMIIAAAGMSLQNISYTPVH